MYKCIFDIIFVFATAIMIMIMLKILGHAVGIDFITLIHYKITKISSICGQKHKINYLELINIINFNICFRLRFAGRTA